MFNIHGKYAIANVFTNKLENEAISQITKLLNLKIAKDGEFKIMPDAHAGKGCVVGFVGRFKELVAIPNIVGVDIGCGMTTVIFRDNEDVTLAFNDFSKVDNIIRKNIPGGTSVRSKKFIGGSKYAFNEIHDLIDEVSRDISSDKSEYFKLSLGTLGGGNHFIEIGRTESGLLSLVVHSGSRNFGKCIAEFHQKKAIEYCKKMRENLSMEINNANIINIPELQNAFEYYNIPSELSFLENDDYELYIKHMQIAAKYARINRRSIVEIIIRELGLDGDSMGFVFDTIHNYISEDRIIRKGAIGTYNDNDVVIPMNMKDGIYVCKGLHNENWLFSGPHGAGRIMSRSAAKSSLDLEELKDDMKDIFTTSINASTLDESPRAYKKPEDIVKYIGDTVEIIHTIKPLYNFKA